VVTGVMNNGAQDLFEIEWTDPGGGVHAWLLPVLPGFVLDVDAQRVLADPPLGMLPDALERS
jgi:ribosomal 30S subunit maturation factor RimM